MDPSIKLDLSLSIPETPYSVDEAVELIHRIHLHFESIEDYRLKLRWWMGFVLRHVERPYGTRTELVERLAEKLRKDHGIRANKNTLYQCAKLYDVLSGDYLRYLRWISTRKSVLGRPVYWNDVIEDLLGGRSNSDVIGVEAADEIDYRDVERAIEALENIMLRAAAGSEEAVGVLEAFRQTIVGVMFLQPIPKRIPRSREYLRFVATHGCLVCGRHADPHHALGRRGTGLKPSDFGCVPLCRAHHIEMHRLGSRSFEVLHQVSVKEAALNLLHRFVTGAWLTIELATSETALNVEAA